MATAEEQIDERVYELFFDLQGLRPPLTLKRASMFMRAAYAAGYTHAHLDPEPLTKEVPMLRYPQLFLP